MEKLLPNWHTSPATWKALKPAARDMRKNPTHAERVLWRELRGRRLNGLRFRRQHTFGPYIVDFYCPAARLVVEVDGPVHQGTKEYDASRDDALRSLGLRVVRFTNDQVVRDLGSVLDAITTAALSPSPLGGEGAGG